MDKKTKDRLEVLLISVLSIAAILLVAQMPMPIQIRLPYAWPCWHGLGYLACIS